MNGASFTPKPSPEEMARAQLVSSHGRDLVAAYALEVVDSCEYQNTENMRNTLIPLLAYIAELERNAHTNTL